ncbi:VOC family protein [Isosphaeraceae bacterium EP7]
MSEQSPRSSLISCLRYRDAPAAIDWLDRAFGLQAQLVIRNDDGTIAHAQLTSGGGMIMLGSCGDTEYGRLMKRPEQVGGFVTQSVCMIVDDADAVYASAKKAGAEIVIEIKDEDFGGRSFTCRDPEGQVWTIGTYNPWV